MLRRTGVILTMLLCSLATRVFALGIGAITVDSAINQPLQVRIEILQLGTTRLNDLVIQMASPDDFERFNIERVSFVSNVRFSIESTPQGNFVTLTSSQIVREPYLSFILETRWPSGRLLSEHTILLDLPVFDEQQTSASVRQPISPLLQAPATSTPTQPFVQPRPGDPVAPTVTAPVSPAVQPVEPTAAPESVQTDTAEDEVIETEVAAAQEPTASTIADTAEPVAAEPENEVVEAEVPAAEETLSEPEQSIADETVTADEATEETSEEVPLLATEDEALAEQADADSVDASASPVAEEVVEAQTLATTATDTDTLSDIALQVRPDDSVSMQQTMLAIQQINPEAFANDNINGLRSGQVLRVPSLAEIQAIDPREAVTEVNRQNQEFAQANVQPLAAPDSADPAQTDVQQGQLSVVSGDDDAINGASAPGQEQNAELDQRIAELETELALQQEDADRARIEREDLDARLAEIDIQIAAASEIIRLQDLQLAQLQESLAQAAEEAARQEEPIGAEATIAPGNESTSLLDDALRILTGNTLLLGLIVVLVISVLVAVLLRRNRAAKLEDEELDELEENEFDAVVDEELADEKQEGGDSSELEHELNAIIGDDLDPEESPAADAGYDVASEAQRLIDEGQLNRAESLLRRALTKDANNTGLRWVLAELLVEKRDESDFEQQAEMLAATDDAETRLQELRNRLVSSGDADRDSDNEFSEELAEEFEKEQEAEPEQDADEKEAAPVRDSSDEAKQLAETAEAASFLDDLGIDLDAFDEIEDFGSDSTADENHEEVPAKSAAEDSSDDTDLFAADDVALTFDLAGEDAEAEGSEIDVDAADDDIFVEQDEEEQEEQEEAEEQEEGEGLDFDADELNQLLDTAAEEPEDPAIDSLEFDTSTEDTEASADETDAEEVDLETYSFDTGVETESSVAADDSTTDADAAATEHSESAVEFDFDENDMEAKPETEDENEAPETLDFDLGDTADTIIEVADDGDADTVDISEAAAPAESLDEAEEIDWDANDDDAVSADSEASDDDSDAEIDFDLDATGESDENSELSGADNNDESGELDDELNFLAADEVEIESVADIEEVQLQADDESATKLELAYAYQKMGDIEGAREILLEVIKEGTEEQVKEAGKLLLTMDDSAG